MKRNLRRLGLTLLVARAIGAVPLQSAQATSYEFHSAGPRSVLTGSNAAATKISIAGIGTIECTTAQFEATQTGTEVSTETYESDVLTVTPRLSGCAFLGQQVIVDFNHCAYVYESETTAGNPDGSEHANLKIECAEGNQIEIETTFCTLTIGPQVVSHAARYTKDTSSSIVVGTTGKGIVMGKQKTTAGQTACKSFPTGAVLSITGTPTYQCFKDADGSSPEGTESTTPTEATDEQSPTGCAHAGPFESVEGGTVFTGKNEGVEKVQVGAAGTVECTTSSSEGTVSAEEEPTASTLKMTPSECSFGGKEATVKTNDCAYVLGQSTNGEGHADLEIECAEGHQIEIDTSVCTITIGPQTIKGAVHYKTDTATSSRAVITPSKVKTGKVKATEGQTGCLLFPSGDVGTYNGTQTLECFEDTAALPQEDPTTPQATKEGEGVECPF